MGQFLPMSLARILLLGQFLLLSHLSLYLVISQYQYKLIYVYFVLWILIQCDVIHFVAKIVLVWVFGNIFSLVLCPFEMISSLFTYLFMTPHTPGCKVQANVWMFQHYLIILTFILKIELRLRRVQQLVQDHPESKQLN